MKKVIIYGAETQNHITLIRTLKRIGLKTLILAKSGTSLGRYSLYAHEVLIMPSYPPTDEYLSNLVINRKISHIVTANLQDSIFIHELKQKDILGDVTIIDQKLDVLKIIQDKTAVKEIFKVIDAPFIENKVIAHDDDFDTKMLDMDYPARFFDMDLPIEKRKILQSTNFVDFKRQVKKICHQKHRVSVIDKEFNSQCLYQDHYFFVEGKIKHVWRGQSYISPHDMLAQNNIVTVLPRRQTSNIIVDQVIYKIAKNLNITQDLLSIHYFMDQKTQEITYVDLFAGGTLPDMPLFQLTQIKMLEARLKLYGFKSVNERGKALKKSYIYLSGKQKYKSFISLAESFPNAKLPLLGLTPVIPFLDSNDLNPFICLAWRFLKQSPYYFLEFITKKYKKLHTIYQIYKGRKRFE